MLFLFSEAEVIVFTLHAVYVFVHSDNRNLCTVGGDARVDEDGYVGLVFTGRFLI